MKKNATRIGLIDDHKLVRQGLKELLEKMGTFEVSHEFDSGTAFIEALPLDDAPDLLLLDYSMPGMNGIEVLQALSENFPDRYKVLLLTQHFDENIIDAAYHYDARGFLHKNCTANDLKFAIDNVVTIGYNNVSEILRRSRQYRLPREHEPKIELSNRERNFLELVCDARELTYDQMAAIMKVSVKSIEAYRAALFDRYAIKSKVGLVLFSFRHHLTAPFI